MNIVKAMKKTGKTGILILLVTLVLWTFVEAAITVTGSWSLSIGQTNLQGAAGMTGGGRTEWVYRTLPDGGGDDERDHGDDGGRVLVINEPAYAFTDRRGIIPEEAQDD